MLEWEARSYFAALDSPKLRLVVNSDTGATSIRNTLGEPVAIDGYSIRSASGALDPGGWSGLQDQGAVGWHESNAGPTQLYEMNQNGSLPLNSSDRKGRGTPYHPPAVPFGQAPPSGDLVFQYTTPDGHDFLIWQRHLGAVVSTTMVQVAVPEPQSWLLACSLGSALFCQRRTWRR